MKNTIINNLHYRNASLEDLAFIVDVYNSTIPSRLVTADLTPVSVEGKTNWFYEHNPSTRPLWIIEDEFNNPIGWLSFQDFYGRPAYDGCAEISIYLDTNYRNGGIGKSSLLYAIQKCPELKIHTLLGFIFEQNTASIRLFAKLGFTEWGHLENIALLDQKYCSLKIFGKKISS